MNARLLAAAAALAVTLGACGGSISTTDKLVTASQTASNGPACADLYRPGAIVTAEQVTAGCRRPDGSGQLSATIACKDGRSIIADDGPPAVWGFIGEPLVAVVGATSVDDPAYSAAFWSCVSK